MIEQINANTYLQTYSGKVLVILERLVVVNGRLYRNRIVEEVGIANLYPRHDVVELLAGMYILTVYAKIYAVLLNVVATTDTNRELICNFLFARVIIVELSEKQKVVGNEITSLSLCAIENFSDPVYFILKPVSEPPTYTLSSSN